MRIGVSRRFGESAPLRTPFRRGGSLFSNYRTTGRFGILARWSAIMLLKSNPGIVTG
jgi:hypothetical protein